MFRCTKQLKPGVYSTQASSEGALVEKDGAYVFVKDIEFTSPSSAAATIHGGSANGLTAWVNKDGVQLKQSQNV